MKYSDTTRPINKLMMWDKTKFHCRDPHGIYFQFLIGSEWRKELAGSHDEDYLPVPTNVVLVVVVVRGRIKAKLEMSNLPEIFIDKWRNKWAHLSERDSFIGTLRPRQTGGIRAGRGFGRVGSLIWRYLVQHSILHILMVIVMPS